MLRKGFTLIELLIVITIIAILAGAAIPYVQDYVDDARFAKAKADLDEIRNALIRFETDRGTPYPTTNTSLSELVGPYLQSSLVDPWGSPYLIFAASSTAVCYGPNRALAGGDDIVNEFRPPLALSKGYWEDSNADGAVSINDSLILNFTRPVATGTVPVSGIHFKLDGAAQVAGFVTPNVASYSADGRSIRITIAALPTPSLAPGKSVLGMALTTGFVDPVANQIRSANTVVVKAR